MAEHSPQVKKRLAQDHERSRLDALDRADGQYPSRVLLWSLYIFADYYYSGQNILDFGLDDAMKFGKVAENEKGIWLMAKGSTKTKSTVAKELSDALAFISIATGKKVLPYQEYFVLHGGFAIAFNGQISAGYPIAEDLQCCPQYELFKSAINKCTKSLAITQLDNGKLSIQGEKLRAMVECMALDDFPYTAPDPVAIKPNGERATIDDRLKVAFAVCGNVVSENGNRMIECALNLNGQICTATDGKVLMQYLHGNDLPPFDMVVPKVFAASVGKVKSPLKEFGWTQDRSVTFYFENGAWIKTQVYQDKYPNVELIINVASKPKPVVAEFFEAIETVSAHNEGIVRFKAGKVTSHEKENIGAQYELAVFEAGLMLDNEYVKVVAPFANQVDMTSYHDRLIVFGENMRGIVLGCRPVGDAIGENVQRVNADDSARVHDAALPQYMQEDDESDIPF